MFGFIWLLLTIVVIMVKGIGGEAIGLLASCPLFLYFGWKYQYLMMMNLHKRRTALLGMLFPEFLTSFISLLKAYSGGNLINTIELTAPYVKEPLRTELLIATEKVKKNPEPEEVYAAFMDLARFVGTKEASQIMLLLYEMFESGVNEDALAELENKIDRLNDNKIKDMVIRKSTKMRGMSLPALMVAVGFIFVWTGVILFSYVSDTMQGLNF